MEQLFESGKVRPTIGIAMSSNETIKQSVIAGLGIAFISAHTVATELDERQLVTLDVDGLPVIRQWFVLARRDKVLLPPAGFPQRQGDSISPAHPRQNLSLTRPSPRRQALNRAAARPPHGTSPS
jgi:LysR family transcriptional regulator for metE and metH